MSRFIPVAMLCLGIQMLMPGAVDATPRYVTDTLEVPLRSGESSRHRIVRMLPSGTPVTVLSVNATTDYARVRTEDGTVGFILERELQDEPAARNRVAALEARIAELQAEPAALAARLAAVQSEYDRMAAESQALQRRKHQLEEELATIRHASANILDITSDRERLRIQVSELIRERADLQQANRDLGNQTQQRWFMIGGGVVVVGILIGLFLPHLRFRRRRSSWGSL